jgi:uncharacterized membrane protein
VTSRWRPIATTVVCLAGLGLAAFLTYGHYFDQKAINACPLGSKTGLISCSAVTTSPESMIFGVPVAAYGLAYFLVMALICLPVSWRSPSVWLARGRLALSVAGMGFVLYLVSVEFLEVHHLCLDCTGVHVLQFALFLLVVTGWYDTGYAQLCYEEADDEGYPGGEIAPPAGRAARSKPARHSAAVSR